MATKNTWANRAVPERSARWLPQVGRTYFEACISLSDASWSRYCLPNHARKVTQTVWVLHVAFRHSTRYGYVFFFPTCKLFILHACPVMFTHFFCCLNPIQLFNILKPFFLFSLRYFYTWRLCSSFHASYLHIIHVFIFQFWFFFFFYTRFIYLRVISLHVLHML